MKYIAVFLIWNMLLLSSITGMAGIHHKKASCFKENTHSDCCKKQRPDHANDCSGGTCNVMLACSTCGFVISPSVALSPAIIDLDNQLSHPFSMGELSAYPSNDWNPPKA